MLDSLSKNYTVFVPTDRAIEKMQQTAVGRKYLDPLRIADRGPNVVSFFVNYGIV